LADTLLLFSPAEWFFAVGGQGVAGWCKQIFPMAKWLRIVRAGGVFG